MRLQPNTYARCARSYEHVLVGPLFRPFAEHLVARPSEDERGELAGRIVADGKTVIAAQRGTAGSYSRSPARSP
jgi:hypothetical protein